MRYLFIQQHQGQFALSALYRVLAVCRNDYYAWRIGLPSSQEQANAHLTEQIQLGYVSPEAFERQYQQQQRSMVA